MRLQTTHVAAAAVMYLAYEDLCDGIWGMLMREHSNLSHRQVEIIDPEYEREIDRRVYYSQVGATPWLWAIVHRLHHMFGDVRGLDYYSRFDRGFLNTLLLSAVYVHEAKHEEGIYDLFPDLKPTPEQAEMFASDKPAWGRKALKYGVLPNLIVLPSRSPKAHLIATACGAFVGTMSVMGIMFGGGMINSVAHWKWRAKKRGYRKALDGSTAANHPWLAKLTKLRELFHRTHHDRPTELNFACETPGGVDLVYMRCLELEREGKVVVGYSGDNPGVELFDEDAVTEFVRRRGNVEDLERWYHDVVRHVPPHELAELHPIEDDKFRHYAQVGMLILRGHLREEAGLAAAA